ncbi:MAG: response regulator transcription factor [Paenibacillus sp.]|nr:response regulator transcription factor [Paenibacillus sp.]
MLSNHQVLIVNSDRNMRDLLRIFLLGKGFSIKEAGTGQEALTMVSNHSFDIILLDVIMPDMDGCQVCRIVRETEIVPILMLSECTEIKEKVHCFKIGADDFLTKPIDLEELLARMNSLLRRAAITQNTLSMTSVLHFPGIKIHLDVREIQIREIVVKLTKKEIQLLTILAQNSQLVYTREELVDRMFGIEYKGYDRVVDTHIKNIREKLQKEGLEYNLIQTVRGVGYRLYISGQNE